LEPMTTTLIHPGANKGASATKTARRADRKPGHTPFYIGGPAESPKRGKGGPAEPNLGAHYLPLDVTSD